MQVSGTRIPADRAADRPPSTVCPDVRATGGKDELLKRVYLAWVCVCVYARTHP